MENSIIYVYGVVYLFTNKLNGKRYVGQSVDLKQRLGEHFRHAFNPHATKPKRHNLFQNALRKYGWEGFNISVLCSCSSQVELDLMEDLYIVMFGTMNTDKGYNLKRGGAKGPIGEDGRRKLREGKLGKKNPAYRPDIPSADELFPLYQENKNLALVGKMFGVTGTTIGKRLRESGYEIIPLLGRNFSAEYCKTKSEKYSGKNHPCYKHEILTEEIVRMYVEEKLSTPKIGKIFSITARTVKLRLDEAGVRRRTIAEAHEANRSKLREVQK